MVEAALKLVYALNMQRSVCATPKEGKIFHCSLYLPLLKPLVEVSYLE